MARGGGAGGEVKIESIDEAGGCTRMGSQPFKDGCDATAYES